MKKSSIIFLICFSIIILSLSFASASWFGDIWNKITGKVVSSLECSDGTPVGKIEIGTGSARWLCVNYQEQNQNLDCYGGSKEMGNTIFGLEKNGWVCGRWGWECGGTAFNSGYCCSGVHQSEECPTTFTKSCENYYGNGWWPSYLPTYASSLLVACDTTSATCPNVNDATFGGKCYSSSTYKSDFHRTVQKNVFRSNDTIVLTYNINGNPDSVYYGKWIDCDTTQEHCAACDNVALWTDDLNKKLDKSNNVEGIANCVGAQCWIKSGETSVGEYKTQTQAGCCGDDVNEYPVRQYSIRGDFIGIICCDSATDTIDANGKCVTATQPKEICTDSDGGKNYYVKGNTFIRTNVVADFCDGSVLTEGYCENNERYEENYNCPNSCENGECLKENCMELIDGHNNIEEYRVNIIFVGFNFENIVDVKNTANTYVNQLVSYEPFTSNQDKFNYWYIDQLPIINNPSASGMGLEMKSIGVELASHCLVQNKQIVSIGNWTFRSNADNYLGYTGRIRISAEGAGMSTFSHEFGHSFGLLHDEYSDYKAYGYTSGSSYQYINCDDYTNGIVCSKWCNAAKTKDEVENLPCNGTNASSCKANKYCDWAVGSTGQIGCINSIELCKQYKTNESCKQADSGGIYSGNPICEWNDLPNTWWGKPGCIPYGRFASVDIGIDCIKDTGCYNGCGYINWHKPYFYGSIMAGYGNERDLEFKYLHRKQICNRLKQLTDSAGGVCATEFGII